MEEILNEVNRPVFWFSVVLVGLVVGVLSSGLWKAAEILFAKFSARRRAKLAAQSDERQARVSFMATDPFLIMSNRFMELRFRLWAFVFLFLMPPLVGLAAVPWQWKVPLFLVAGFAGVHAMFRCMDISAEVTDAEILYVRKKRKEVGV